MVGSEVAGLAAGAGVVLLCAHTLHGTSNAATPTPTRRMNAPQSSWRKARKSGELPP